MTAAFVLAGLVHSAWLRSRLSARLRIPLDGRRTLRGKRIFGDNKTLRGFVVLVPAVGAAFWLLSTFLPAGWRASLWSLSPAGYGLLGCWVGFGFMAAELPNSFCKRQLGIAPGEAPASRWARPVCFLIDRLDSIAGAFVALAVAVPTPLVTWLYLLMIGPGVHWSFSLLLFRLGVKGRPA
jgi:CDP-2,3-bis-(O-geranylgeranyl)-sn-glycerol synthase